MFIPLFDWNKSGYVNAREQITKEAVTGARKFSVWKRHMHDAEMVGRVDNTFVGTLNEDSHRYLSAADYDAVLSNMGVEAPTVVIGADNWDIDGVLIPEDVLTPYTLIPSSSLGNTQGTGTFNSISRLDILSFLKKYQVDNSLPYYAINGSRLGLTEVRDMLQRVQARLSTYTSGRFVWTAGCSRYNSDDGSCYDATPFIITTGIKNQILFENTVASVRYTSDQKKSYLYYLSQNKDGAYHNITKSTCGSPATDCITTSTITGSIPTMVDSTLASVRDITVLSDTTEEEKADREMYQAISHIWDVLEDNGDVVTEISTACKYEWLTDCTMSVRPVASLEAVQFVLQQLIDNAQELKDLQDAGENNAKEEPIGKILFQFSNLRALLEMDTSKLDYMFITFRINLFKTLNDGWLEDQDEQSNAALFDTMKDVVGRDKWLRYMNVALRSKVVYVDETTSNSYWVPVAYIPNWDMISKLPPRKGAAILQAMMNIETSVPKPKKKRSWVAFIIAVILTITSWGTLSPLLSYVMVTTLVVQGLAILTGSEGLAKLSKALGILTMVISVVNIVQAGVKTASTFIAQVKLNAVAMVSAGLDKIYAHKLSGMKQGNQNLSEEVDAVEELIANQTLDMNDKIDRFIYGEHQDLRYTVNYDFDNQYRYKYMV